MHFAPDITSRSVLRGLALGAAVASLCGGVIAGGASTSPQTRFSANDGAIPQPLSDDAFEALVTHSPFTRTLGAPDSLILTGVARFDQDVFATLLDTKTMESHVVSSMPNSAGWQLIGIAGDPERTQTLSAKVQLPGGETVAIRYSQPPPRPPRSAYSRGSSGQGVPGGPGGSPPPLSNSQAAEAKNAAVNYREGFTSDGYPNQPPPEMVEKLSRLSVTQREDINRQMIGLRNQGLGMEERRRIYEGMVDRAVRR